jgi:hypothetical protein
MEEEVEERKIPETRMLNPFGATENTTSFRTRKLGPSWPERQLEGCVQPLEAKE